MSVAASHLKSITLNLETNQVHLVIVKQFGTLSSEEQLTITEHSDITAGIAAANEILIQGGFPAIPDDQIAVVASHGDAIRAALAPA